MTMADDLGIVTHNGGAVVDLCVALLALLHTLLDVGRVHDGLAHGPGHLALMLLGHLVALLLHVLLAVRSRGVAITRLSLSISLPLVVAVTSMDDLGVVSNDSGAVVHLLVGLLAVLGHDVLALLDVGRVHYHVVLLVALLVIHVVALLVMDHIVNRVALGVSPVVAGGGVGEGGPGEEECGTQLGHHPEYLFPPTLLRGS